MKTVCDLDDCTGCMACIDICGKHAISIQYNLKSYALIVAYVQRYVRTITKFNLANLQNGIKVGLMMNKIA